MMKKCKLMLTLLLVFVVSVSFSMPTSAATKATISLNKTSISITRGSSTVLKATVKGKSKKVTWSSKNSSIASVSSSGKVTAKKVGTTYITAKANGVSKTCKVQVKENIRTIFQKAATGKWMKSTSASFGQYSKFTTKERVYYNKKTGKVIAREKIADIKKKTGDKYYVTMAGKYGKYELRCTIKNGKVQSGMEYWWYDHGWKYSGSSSLYKIK